MRTGLSLLLAALLAAHLLATSAFTPHGPLSVDECTYQLMARAAAGGTLSAWNGYEEFASPELAFVTLVPHGGALYPVPPALYAGLAWPFYRAQGFAHVMAHLTRAVRREYAGELAERATVIELLDQVETSFSEAALLKPVVVLDGSADGLFANHRRNLDAYLVNARQLLFSVIEELEK